MPVLTAVPLLWYAAAADIAAAACILDDGCLAVMVGDATSVNIHADASLASPYCKVAAAAAAVAAPYDGRMCFKHQSDNLDGMTSS